MFPENNNDNNLNIDILDAISLTSFVIQIFTLLQNFKQASNDKILKELKFQDNDIFEKIINNQITIMRKLESIEKIIKGKGELVKNVQN